MNSISDLGLAYGESVLSSVGQYFAGITKKATGLTESTDVVLHWGVARHLDDIREDLLEISLHPNATSKVKTWGRYLVAAETSELEKIMKSERYRLGVAHFIGEVGMIGTSRRTPDLEVFKKLPDEMTDLLPPESRDKSHSAVVVRVGSGAYIGGFVSIERNARNIQPIPTINLGVVASTPEQLRRI
jgi:hypothetical protein